MYEKNLYIFKRIRSYRGQAGVELVVLISCMMMILIGSYAAYMAGDLKFTAMLESRNKVFEANGKDTKLHSMKIKKSIYKSSFKNPVNGKKGVIKSVYHGTFQGSSGH